MDSAKLFFRENPFPTSPAADRYLAIGSAEVARKRLMDAIDRRECPGMLVGPPGTGKSMLCTLIAGAYRNEFDVVLLAESRLCTRKALLQHLLHHLGLPYSDQTEGELRLALIDRAASGGPASRAGLLIVVDEAHTLPGRLLEELRMMSGIVRNGSPRVQLILAGGPSLDERFAHPRMEAFSQRISTRCYLHPLGQNETGNYVRDAIRHAGANPLTAVDDEAIAAVYYAADGIPRLINQTMSRAVNLAAAESQSRITAEIVQRAWADLQQLPSPVVGRRVAAASEQARDSEDSLDVVEFGTLDAEFGESDPMAETVDYEAGDAGVTDRAWSEAAALELTSDRVESQSREAAVLETAGMEAADGDWPGADADTVEATDELEAAESEEIVGIAATSRIDDASELNSQFAAAELSPEEGSQLETAGWQATEWSASDWDAVDWAPAVVETGDWEPVVAQADLAPACELAADMAEDERVEDAASVEKGSAGGIDLLELFGDGFEQEESLAVQSLPQRGAASLRPAALADSSVGGSGDDEESLHREIVSINAEAVRNETYGTFGDLSMSQDILIADDSDMLVIEDDVELDVRVGAFPPQRPRAGEETAGEISFQSMFTRMREG